MAQASSYITPGFPSPPRGQSPGGEPPPWIAAPKPGGIPSAYFQGWASPSPGHSLPPGWPPYASVPSEGTSPRSTSPPSGYQLPPGWPPYGLPTAGTPYPSAMPVPLPHGRPLASPLRRPTSARPASPFPRKPKPSSNINPDKPYPSGAPKASGFTFTVPPGWKTTISSSAQQTAEHGIAVEYFRDQRRVRTILRSKLGAADGQMHSMVDGETTILVQAFHQSTTLVLKWYAHKIQEGWFADSITPKNTIDSPDEAQYVVDVLRQSEYAPDQITVIHFNRVVPSKDPLNLANIQGDVVPGLPKALEYFYYFQIIDVAHFQRSFASFALPKIVTSSQLVTDPPPPAPSNPTHPFLGFNVAFTSHGIQLFGLDPGQIGDAAFLRGQIADARNLGDRGYAHGEAWEPAWDAEFRADIHGIFIITAYNEATAQSFIRDLERAFAWTPRRSSIKKVVNLHAYPRPGDEAMNDAFGYRGGGMSNPQIKDVTFTDKKPMRYSGTAVIPIGVIVMGRDGDEDKHLRPAWAVDGSLVVTRKLNCRVPEFDDYCMSEGMKLFEDLAPDQAAAKFGARLMGRWKNGTPVAMSPDHDAPEIAKDDSRVNNFQFDQYDTAQRTCPFATHIRKSNPRNDAPPEERLKHLIRRHNMSYGPEVTDEERTSGTIEERGLHLCAYQSSIQRGFQHIQTAWFNQPDFPPQKSVEPGWDPLLGQTGDPHSDRYMTGLDPAHPDKVTTFMETFVDPRGGAYFFAPSLKTLRKYIALQSE
ncbi:hypothetical protein C8F01DRAFT_1141391 [Mycena amicta]|nr:hypothetical protein C8F01DRAFT_1141391 [Mycena amicta]